MCIQLRVVIVYLHFLLIRLPPGLINTGLFDHDRYPSKLYDVALSENAPPFGHFFLLIHTLQLMKVTQSAIGSYDHEGLLADILQLL